LIAAARGVILRVQPFHAVFRATGQPPLPSHRSTDMRNLKLALLAAVPLAFACSPAADAPRDAGTPEAVSLLGTNLYPREFGEEARQRLEGNLAEARARYDADAASADNIIWLGRRQAYLERYRDAIATFSEGIEKHPNDPRMYRHRGHRYITVRDFDRAIADFERAVELTRGQPDEVEPDGAPNARNIPTSTLQSNIWYHLGLAYYLKGDWDNALRSYREAMNVSNNEDTKVATSDWLYMTLRRMGRDEEARQVLEPITADMDIIENGSYHRRLLMYKGELPAEELLNPEDGDALTLATQGYGVGNWYLYNGQPERAREIFQRVVDMEFWAAFGYIAAEAELARGVS
jgi:tetratricopeptide (TPR) repeat protein